MDQHTAKFCNGQDWGIGENILPEEETTGYILVQQIYNVYITSHCIFGSISSHIYLHCIHG